ncbi:MAG: cytochrome c biogenesis protein CcsA [Akkermansiaceae bacterium]|nr:cytochrome c biogenesis protein CcsA [Akkermansiaceae bacterium]
MNSSLIIVMRWVVAVLICLDLTNSIYKVAKENRSKGEPPVIEGYEPWSKEVLELAGKLPVQDGGRVKPLSTYARFTMLRLRGDRSMKIRDGEGEVHKIGATAWLLDCLFRPAIAMELPSFRIDNADALKAIGVETRGRRDRYSYSEIEKGREKLTQLSEIYGAIDSKEREPVEGQIVDLDQNMRLFETLFVHFNFARNGIVLVGSGDEDGIDKRANVSAFMKMAPQLRAEINRIERSGERMPPQIMSLLDQITQQSNFAKFSLFPLPPLENKHDELVRWDSAGKAIFSVMTGDNVDPATSIEDIEHLESLVRKVEEPDGFRAELEKFNNHIAARSAGMESVETIGMEHAYYKVGWFKWAMAFFLLGTLCAIPMCLLGSSLPGKIAYWSTSVLTGLGTLCCIIAIVIRCLIMHRPPIGNLYDTIIFIAAAVALLSLVSEWMTRRRFALTLGPVLGLILITLAWRFETGDASDHMDPLVAVLDSNYWLTTHVITITLGYAAGLLSAFLSASYILMRGLRLDSEGSDARRMLTRATYGMLCLTLLLSLVGTVLGGIWANDSWGRFWGWDPKENGALMIVIWVLVILHARMGGYIREWGLHIATVFTAIVVTFSWWHVNFLGVGLHNYGFTSGKDAIWGFYLRIAILIGLGIFFASLEKANRKKVEGKKGGDALPA